MNIKIEKVIHLGTTSKNFLLIDGNSTIAVGNNKDPGDFFNGRMIVITNMLQL